MDPVRPRLERETTDESLDSERSTADEAILARRFRLERDADQLIADARVEADSVVDIAREAADHGVGTPTAEIVEQRLLADHLIDEARAAADEQLRSERESHAHLLATLIPLERMRTDRDLLTERARSDARLANRDDFLGMIGHDLRTLLCGLLLESSALADDAADSPEGQRTIAAVQRLKEYVARMNRLVGELLDADGADSRKPALEPKLREVRPLTPPGGRTLARAAAEPNATPGVGDNRGPATGRRRSQDRPG